MKSFVLASLVAVAQFAASAVHAATLDGQSLTIEFVQNNGGEVVFDPQTAVVGAGVEASFFQSLNVDVSGDIISIIAFGSSSFGNIPFNGWRITDTNGTIDAFSALTLLPGGDFPEATFSVSADEILLNFNETGSFVAGDTAEFRVSFGPVGTVPLPAGLPLLLAGLGGLGLLAKRRRQP